MEKMEKKNSKGISLEYESLNDRILRLKKESTTINRTKDRSIDRQRQSRQSCQIHQQKHEKPIQINRVMKQNKLKIDVNQISKSQLDIQSFLSPRRYRVPKVIHQRIPTQNDQKNTTFNISQCRSPLRVPGKIIKNPSTKMLFQDVSRNLKKNQKFFI